ncbi:MAG: thioredoxin family protein [Bacteroidota bacterium]|nr:thioredoxin family protein [Bacteroidota bacterium]
MKHSLVPLLICSLFVPCRIFAQKSNSPFPDSNSAVHWQFSGSGSRSGGYTLDLRARIEPGWRLYSTTMPDSLPFSRVSVDSQSGARILGPIVEKGSLHTAKDSLFGNVLIRYFEGEVHFLVRLQPHPTSLSDIKGTVTFMARLKDSITAPMDVPFRFSVSAGGALIARRTALNDSSAAAVNLRRPSIDLSRPVSPCGGTGAEDSKSRSLLGIFFLGILGGLLGLIMPCTFPMIPLTVAFFTKASPTRSKGIFNASMYGFFIFVIYVLLSLPFYFLKASNVGILNDISTNVWLNLLFTAIFIAFALSFFGLFEIALPGSLTSSVNSRSGIGSLGGIFFLALTLAIVSFSCTGPRLGTLLVGALDANGGSIQLTFAMAGFGLALGLPFALFALFPNWLHSLPKSGSWMNTFKVVFGLIELALAAKFISNADLVMHWGLLKRETFFAIWILIGMLIVIYLARPRQGLMSVRNWLALAFLAFVAYLSPGLTNTPAANRPLVSGFPPPLSYSLYKNRPARGVEANVINDYEKALKLAREEHKPVLIDFTGWACVNCRKMEENVWPKPGVAELIRDHFVLVSLYVDDRKVLADDQQFLFTTRDGSKKAIRTVGDKFATLQSENFKNASQPLYAIISPDERLMVYPVGYTPDPAEYGAWLQCGLDAFGKSH